MTPITLGVVAGVIAALLSGIVWFGRDPDRSPPDDPRVILAPADGHVVAVERVTSPRWLNGPVWRIAIFLSLWDVHVQRAPIAGRVALAESKPGRHLPALLPGAAENAGHWLGIEEAQARVLVLRSAGILARRVTTCVELGQPLAAGERIGRILFGSRAEVFVPEHASLQVRAGQIVRAGETTLARWPDEAGTKEGG